MREITKYGNYVSRAKIKNDVARAYSTLLKAQIANMKARKYVMIEQLQKDLPVDQMIYIYRKLIELEYRLQNKLAIYNGEWKYQGPYHRFDEITQIA